VSRNAAQVIARVYPRGFGRPTLKNQRGEILMLYLATHSVIRSAIPHRRAGDCGNDDETQQQQSMVAADRPWTRLLHTFAAVLVLSCAIPQAEAQPPGAAQLIEPYGNVWDTTPTYAWKPVTGATWYRLWVNDRAGTRIVQWYTTSETGCPSGGGTCSVTPSTSLNAGAATWWVQTWNSSGVGPWSEPMSFVALNEGAPGEATLISPNGAIADSTPTFTWNAVPDATWYYLWVNDSVGTRIKRWYQAYEVGCSGGTGSCGATAETALKAGGGKWWILTWNASGYGPWSAPLAFTVGSNDPLRLTTVQDRTLFLESDGTGYIMRYDFTTSSQGLRRDSLGNSTGIIYGYYTTGAEIQNDNEAILSYSYGYGYRWDAKILFTFETGTSGTYLRTDESQFGLLTTTGRFEFVR
jgi:hypothetical protein